jgi:hypothetical protein
MEQICKDCQEPFVLNERDKQYFEGNGLSLPKRCYYCRQKRRDAKRMFDLRNGIGQYIARTKPSIHGDRSYLGEQGKVKLLEVRDDGSLVVEGKYFWEKDEPRILQPDLNDGYWKVIES